MLPWGLCCITVLIYHLCLLESRGKRWYERMFCSHLTSCYFGFNPEVCPSVLCLLKYFGLGATIVEKSVSIKPSFVGFWLKQPLVKSTFCPPLWGLSADGIQKEITPVTSTHNRLAASLLSQKVSSEKSSCGSLYTL